MEHSHFSQYSETHPLKKVIIGRYEGYAKSDAYIEIVNESQKKGLPDRALLAREFESLKATLEARDIEVLIPQQVGDFVYDQLTPRDIGVTIGDRFVICNMVKSSRRYEVAGIFSYLNEMTGRSPALLIPPKPDMLLEGGDIIIDNNLIFVGISQRTNEKGFHFLQQIFGNEFTLIPVYCSALEEGEDVLHLDCTFNRIGKSHALIYPGGFRQIPEAIHQYDWITISREEQRFLGSNVLSLDEHSLISRAHPKLESLNNKMREAGFEVIELAFDGATATGGSFRCCSLPLVRSA